MNLQIIYSSPVLLLLYVATTQLVAGCDHRLNCTECLRSENCEYLRCGILSYCGNKTEVSMCRTTDVITDIQFCPKPDFPNDDVSNETTTTITGSPIATINVTTTTVVSGKPTTLLTTTTTTTTTPAPTTRTTTSTTTEAAETFKELPSSPPSIFTPMDGQSTSINRRFDGPSFIGGIILTFGLLAVVYVGFKFYRARTERNYHTLRESSVHI